MRNYLKNTKISKFAVMIMMFISLSFYGIILPAKAETKAASLGLRATKTAPLNLADVLTGLRSKKTSLAQRNKLLTAAVKQRGVTFTLTAEIEKELKTAGANTVLLEAIRDKSPKQNVKPSGAMRSFDVTHNASVSGRKGMIIQPDFTVYNLKNIPAQFIILFETADGRPLRAVSQNFASTNGSLIVGDFLNPRTDAQNYNTLSYFLPYGEISLGRGTHNLRMNVMLIYDDGTPITQFDYYYFDFMVN